MNEYLEALKTALDFEIRGARFYLDTARKVKDESGKNILIRLALDELDHYEILLKQRESLEKEGKWGSVEVKKSVIEKLLPKIERKQTGKGEYHISELDALEMALEQEKKSRDYYDEQAKKVESREAKEMFLRLRDMEEAHYTLIQAEIDHIRGYGFWMGFQEFDME